MDEPKQGGLEPGIPTGPRGPVEPAGGGLLTWARSRTMHLPAERAQIKALTLEPGEYDGTAKHPFPTADREAYLEAVRGKGIAQRTLTAPIGRIQLSALKGIQRTVNRERLRQHLENPSLIPENQRAPGHGGYVDLPVVVKLKGEYHIHDGHHRSVAAFLRGDPAIRCRLIDLDADESGI